MAQASANLALVASWFASIDLVRDAFDLEINWCMQEKNSLG